MGSVADVVGGVVGELLGEVDVGELRPAALALVFGELVLDQVGEDGGAEAFDAADDGAVVAAFDPLIFQRREEVVDELRSRRFGGSDGLRAGRGIRFP